MATGRQCAREGRPFHMAGCMLFWAEGSRSRNSVYFTNSDPAMVRFFLDFLVDEVGVGRHAVRIDINLFADHRAEQRRIEQHWLDTLELPAVCLRASTVNVYSRHSARKRLNRLPYGTCRLSVHSTRTCSTSTGRSRRTAASSDPSGSTASGDGVPMTPTWGSSSGLTTRRRHQRTAMTPWCRDASDPRKSA